MHLAHARPDTLLTCRPSDRIDCDQWMYGAVPEIWEWSHNSIKSSCALVTDRSQDLTNYEDADNICNMLRSLLGAFLCQVAFYSSWRGMIQRWSSTSKTSYTPSGPRQGQRRCGNVIHYFTFLFLLQVRFDVPDRLGVQKVFGLWWMPLYNCTIQSKSKVPSPESRPVYREFRLIGVW